VLRGRFPTTTRRTPVATKRRPCSSPADRHCHTRLGPPLPSWSASTAASNGMQPASSMTSSRQRSRRMPSLARAAAVSCVRRAGCRSSRSGRLGAGWSTGLPRDLTVPAVRTAALGGAGALDGLGFSRWLPRSASWQVALAWCARRSHEARRTRQPSQMARPGHCCQHQFLPADLRASPGQRLWLTPILAHLAAFSVSSRRKPIGCHAGGGPP